VLSKLKRRVFLEILYFLVKEDILLWGQKQGRNYIKKCLALALYKDLFAVGYDRLHQLVYAWHRVGVKTLQHNTKWIREKTAQWGKQRIALGSLSDWNCAARSLQLKKKYATICLWIDSFDIAMEGKRRIS